MAVPDGFLDDGIAVFGRPPRGVKLRLILLMISECKRTKLFLQFCPVIQGANTRISKAEMAKRLDMDSSNYHRLEGRGDKLTIEQTRLIANALELTVVDLLTWGEKQEDASNNRTRNSEIIEKLEDRIKEITISRDLLQEYTDSTKRKLSDIQSEFNRTIEYIGDDAEIGTMHVQEQNKEYMIYNRTFSDEDLLEIFETIYLDHGHLYELLFSLVRNDILDSSRRETKLFLGFTVRKMALRKRRKEKS